MLNREVMISKLRLHLVVLCCRLVFETTQMWVSRGLVYWCIIVVVVLMVMGVNVVPMHADILNAKKDQSATLVSILVTNTTMLLRSM